MLKSRRRKAFERYNFIRNKRLDVKEEARRLYFIELEDKKLNKSYYYEPNEPSEFVRYKLILLFDFN